MLERPLGAGAPAVSAIGFGGMHLSIQERPPETDAIRVIHAALDAGVTLVDTANVYCLDQADLGHNERLIARALASWQGRRDHVLVATKGGMTRPGGRWERDGRPASLERACDESLKALGVDQIALYQLHAPDPAVPFAESIGALTRLAERGKIRWIGLSNVSVSQIREAQAITPIASVQNRLNPFFREAIADGVVQYCTRQKVGFLAYSPTGGGRLNRKLPDHAVLRVMSNDLGFSPHALVLAWVLAQGPTVFAIPSARRVEHAMDAARAADIVLSERDLLRITEAEFSRA
ncbi:MAG TPA: aldo/keto reductase [Gemmatimonadales bacterium]|nr:aldo/keto reductase [Gemmatimonadales bacterium]